MFTGLVTGMTGHRLTESQPGRSGTLKRPTSTLSVGGEVVSSGKCGWSRAPGAKGAEDWLSDTATLENTSK